MGSRWWVWGKRKDDSIARALAAGAFALHPCACMAAQLGRSCKHACCLRLAACSYR
jgi:hypothetical protein